MTSLLTGLLFLLIWFSAAPLAAARFANDISKEKIAVGFLAWVDRNYGGTMIGYLFRCPICLSHWILGAMSVLCFQGWVLLPFPPLLQFMVAIISTIAAVEITKKLWLSHD